MSFWNSTAFAGLHRGQDFGWTEDEMNYFTENVSDFSCSGTDTCYNPIPSPIIRTISVDGFWSNWPTPSGTTLGAWSPAPDYIDLWGFADVGDLRVGYNPGCSLDIITHLPVCATEVPVTIENHTFEGDGGEEYVPDAFHGSIGGPTPGDGDSPDGDLRNGWIARTVASYTGDPDNDASRILLPWPSIETFDWIFEATAGKITNDSHYFIRTWYFNEDVETPLMMVV